VPPEHVKVVAVVEDVRHHAASWWHTGRLRR
jgi:hypothetical protein